MTKRILFVSSDGETVAVKTGSYAAIMLDDRAGEEQCASPHNSRFEKSANQ